MGADTPWQYIPVVRAVMTSTAAGFDRSALDLSGFLGEATRVRDVEVILDESEASQHRGRATASTVEVLARAVP
ncbi:hypothetical protein [Saccharopolyspora sp. NPDC050642]|uniref:hypothetical protein n=1 Tax=Saccharopolyspora sp. NPDC050642 TaxID=3157099 RepID=UPI0033ED4A1A